MYYILSIPPSCCCICAVLLRSWPTVRTKLKGPIPALFLNSGIKVVCPYYVAKVDISTKIFLFSEAFTSHVHLRPTLQVVEYQNSLGDVAKHSEDEITSCLQKCSAIRRHRHLTNLNDTVTHYDHVLCVMVRLVKIFVLSCTPLPVLFRCPVRYHSQVTILQFRVWSETQVYFFGMNQKRISYKL